MADSRIRRDYHYWKPVITSGRTELTPPSYTEPSGHCELDYNVIYTNPCSFFNFSADTFNIKVINGSPIQKYRWGISSGLSGIGDPSISGETEITLSPAVSWTNLYFLSEPLINLIPDNYLPPENRKVDAQNSNTWIKGYWSGGIYVEDPKGYFLNTNLDLRYATFYGCFFKELISSIEVGCTMWLAEIDTDGETLNIIGYPEDPCEYQSETYNLKLEPDLDKLRYRTYSWDFGKGTGTGGVPSRVYHNYRIALHIRIENKDNFSNTIKFRSDLIYQSYLKYIGLGIQRIPAHGLKLYDPTEEISCMSDAFRLEIYYNQSDRGRTTRYQVSEVPIIDWFKTHPGWGFLPDSKITKIEGKDHEWYEEQQLCDQENPYKNFWGNPKKVKAYEFTRGESDFRIWLQRDLSPTPQLLLYDGMPSTHPKCHVSMNNNKYISWRPGWETEGPNGCEAVSDPENPNSLMNNYPIKGSGWCTGNTLYDHRILTWGQPEDWGIRDCPSISEEKFNNLPNWQDDATDEGPWIQPRGWSGGTMTGDTWIEHDIWDPINPLRYGANGPPLSSEPGDIAQGISAGILGEDNWGIYSTFLKYEIESGADWPPFALDYHDWEKTDPDCRCFGGSRYFRTYISGQKARAIAGTGMTQDELPAGEYIVDDNPPYLNFSGSTGRYLNLDGVDILQISLCYFDHDIFLTYTGLTNDEGHYYIPNLNGIHLRLHRMTHNKWHPFWDIDEIFIPPKNRRFFLCDIETQINSNITGDTSYYTYTKKIINIGPSIQFDPCSGTRYFWVCGQCKTSGGDPISGVTMWFSDNRNSINSKMQAALYLALEWNTWLGTGFTGTISNTKFPPWTEYKEFYLPQDDTETLIGSFLSDELGNLLSSEFWHDDSWAQISLGQTILNIMYSKQNEADWIQVYAKIRIYDGSTGGVVCGPILTVKESIESESCETDCLEYPMNLTLLDKDNINEPELYTIHKNNRIGVELIARNRNEEYRTGRTYLRFGTSVSTVMLNFYDEWGMSGVTDSNGYYKFLFREGETFPPDSSEPTKQISSVSKVRPSYESYSFEPAEYSFELIGAQYFDEDWDPSDYGGLPNLRETYVHTKNCPKYPDRDYTGKDFVLES